MTFRNLNGNDIDRLRDQYKRDLQDGCEHPVRYLLWNPRRSRDIFYLIPSKIDPQTLARSLVAYHRATKDTAIFEWENDHIKVWPHPHDPEVVAAQREREREQVEEANPSIETHTSAVSALVCLALHSANAWDFEIFGETGCEGPSTDLLSGTGDMQCEETPNPHRCFRISNFGNCELYLHANEDDCEAGDFEQFYDQTNADQDISPDYDWDTWSVIC